MSEGQRFGVIAVVALFLAACGKRSEPVVFDLDMATRLYVACVAQSAASPYDCRVNAEAMAEKRKP